MSGSSILGLCFNIVVDNGTAIISYSLDPPLVSFFQRRRN